MSSKNSSSSSAAQHRRGHSTGSMRSRGGGGGARDEDLALFDEMNAKERNNFLHPSTEEDIEASLRYRIVVAAPRAAIKATDLLGLESEKNDYNWLLTPPGTPLFPSLEDAPPSEAHVETAIAIRAAARSRPTSRISRASSSPSRRPSSPSPSTGSLTRRSSFGSSSPSRSNNNNNNSNSRPGTPNRSVTPTNNRRSLTPSSSFNNGNAQRSSSPSTRKLRTNSVHPAMSTAGFGSEPPPNLRTSMPDRPQSNTRGGSLSPRLGGRNLQVDRRPVSPSLSRSQSSSASSSVISCSQNSGVEVKRSRKISTAASNSTSSAATSQRKPFDASGRQMQDSRRNTTSGFRPLMANSHISSFYSRTRNALEHHRPALSITTDSSINSSSAASAQDQDEEVMSKCTEASPADDRKGERIAFKSPDAVMTSLWKSVDEEEEAGDEMDNGIAATPTSSEAFYSTDFRGEIEMECQPSPSSCGQDYAESVRSVLDCVISEAVELAESSQIDHQQAMFPDRYQEAHHQATASDVQQTHLQATAADHQQTDQQLTASDELKTSDYQHQEQKTSELHDEESQKEVRAADRTEASSSSTSSSSSSGKKVRAGDRNEACSSSSSSSSSSSTSSSTSSSSKDSSSMHCFSQLLDPKYSSSSIEVYQFDQELHTTGSEVPDPQQQQQQSPSTSSSGNSNPVEKKTSMITRTPATATTAAAGTSSSSSRSCKPASFMTSKQMQRKRESRESSLFSIQISSSKGGESISSGRPDSVDERFDDANATYSSSYKAYEEYEIKSDESCVDYYIDSMEESKKYVEVEKAVSESSAIPHKDRRHQSFDTDEDGGFVDYYIDDFLSQQKIYGKTAADAADAVATEKVSVLADDQFVEEAEKNLTNHHHRDEEETLESDHQAAEAGATGNAAVNREEDIDTMTECWKQLEEMDCDGKLGRSRSSLSQLSAESVSVVNKTAAENSPAQSTITTNINSNNNTVSSNLNEARDNILFCSSIVHDIVYKAASLGKEKEDLKALATPASADELVTFLGLSKQMGASLANLDAAAAKMKWKSEESTVRRTLAYMQNQKLMQNSSVAFMQQSPVGEVKDDHVIPEHHFIDRSLERREELRLERKPKSKCGCTIL